jgi:hypothetical protein
MSEKAGLINQRVKVVLRRFHPQTPREVMRGIITEADEFGIRVSGRRFQEFPERESAILEEHPVERETKIYWVPYSSIRYSEIIPAGSMSERVDNDIQRRTVMTPLEQTRPQSAAD